MWWLGFDCGHSHDLIPSMAADRRRRFAETGDPLWDESTWDRQETYKVLDYVRAECAGLARQLASVGAATS